MSEEFAKAFKAIDQETEREFDGVQFPSGRCVLDHPETGIFTAATSIEHLPGIDHASIIWEKK